MLDNITTLEFQIDEPLNVGEQDWVIGRLHARHGMHGARLLGNEGRLRLVVKCDAYRFNASDLVHFLEICGLHGKLAPLRHADPNDVYSQPPSAHAA